MPIRTPRLLIRNFLPGDGPEVNQAILESFTELTEWMPWAKERPTVDESEAICRESYSKWILRTDLTLAIFDPSGKRQLGETGLHRMNWEIPSFEIGYWVRTSAAKQGYISEAVNAVTRYAFTVLHAKRVEIRCDADNLRSSKIPEKLGFQLEGKLRQDRLKCHNRGLGDSLIFARINLEGLPHLEVSWGESK